MSEGKGSGGVGTSNNGIPTVSTTNGSGKLGGSGATDSSPLSGDNLPRGITPGGVAPSSGTASGAVGGDSAGAGGSAPNGNKDQWFGFWSNVTNSIIAGIFGLLTLVVGAFLSFRGTQAPGASPPPNAPTTVSADDNTYGTVLEADNPYPAQVRMVALDMKLSEIKALQLPDGKAENGGYSFTLASGPFSSVLCSFKDAGDEDPKIEQISYTFREAGAEAIVRRQAISAFGSKRMRSSQLGAVMRWPNVQGCNVEIDSAHYSVRP